MPVLAFQEIHMTQPPSMLQLYGRAYAPAKLGNATLLVIDPQMEYRMGTLALPGLAPAVEQISILLAAARQQQRPDRKSTRLNSSHVRISYAVFCLKKK